jgi:hypothetical protein
MKTDRLDRLVAAGTIRDIDREHVRFIVRRIVQPPERPDDALPENVGGKRLTMFSMFVGTERLLTSDVIVMVALLAYIGPS